jgi:hypothetical protein
MVENAGLRGQCRSFIHFETIGDFCFENAVLLHMVPNCLKYFLCVYQSVLTEANLGPT